MPLDTSTTYPLTKLRLDGRRWNELRLLQAQISTNPASSGSSYLTMGNTAVLCTVHGPSEGRGSGSSAGATVEVDVNIAGFALVDRRRGGGNDRYLTPCFYLEIFAVGRSVLCGFLLTWMLATQTIRSTRKYSSLCISIAFTNPSFPTQYHTATFISSIIRWITSCSTN